MSFTKVRRAFVASLAVLSLAVFASAGTASAAARAPQNLPPPICVLHTNGAFTEAGEFAAHSSIADILQVECQPIFAGSTVTIDATQLFNACHGYLSFEQPGFTGLSGETPTFDVTLDDDGNAIAAVFGGPGCAASTNLITASLDAPPFTTVYTRFTIRPPHDTTPGVFALPKVEVEDATTSSVATVVYVEFPSVFAEQDVTIHSVELNARCAGGITWVDAQQNIVGTGSSVTVDLDNNGNAFVVAIGGPSCASGRSTIVADLNIAPYTTYVTYFTIYSPRPTI